MCGITGWVDWHRDLGGQRAMVARMTGTMACRGPDDQGLWVSGHAAIGHRRLAVIALVGGVQPMTTGPAGSRTVLTYSGEVYNYLELRNQLRGLGHRFVTDSDTEVVLRSYVQWGADCVERFNGMFAFAVWDEARQRLVLARDPLGVKPLYYHVCPEGVLFGSEPKALLANPLFEPALDAEGIAELFAMFGGRTPGHGVLSGLDEVRPGWTVTIDRDGVRPRRYWQLYSESHVDDRATAVATVRQTLAAAVRRQLVADVPVCVLASGGLDSSVVAALASEARGADLTTFSVDYVGSD